MERGKIVCLTFETFVKAKGGRGEDWSGGGWVWGGVGVGNIDCWMTRG